MKLRMRCTPSSEVRGTMSTSTRARAETEWIPSTASEVRPPSEAPTSTGGVSIRSSTCLMSRALAGTP